MSTTVLALDIGERKIGIARANTIAKIAEPLVTLPNDDLFLQKLNDIMKEHGVSQLVVGLPRGLDGQETKQTRYVRSFADKLDVEANIAFQDEALTSVNAQEILDDTGKHYVKEDIDAMAATLILDDYLKGDL